MKQVHTIKPPNEEVQFWFKEIERLKRVNHKIKQNLQILVGINTRNLIIENSIETSKSTFEI
jgi:hypothetical protein